MTPDDVLALSNIWGYILGGVMACTAVIWVADFFTDLAGDS